MQNHAICNYAGLCARSNICTSIHCHHLRHSWNRHVSKHSRNDFDRDILMLEEQEELAELVEATVQENCTWRAPDPARRCQTRGHYEY
jgi:hypothetical protein